MIKPPSEGGEHSPTASKRSQINRFKRMPQNELWQLSANRAEESEGEAGDTLDYADISKRIN